MRSREFRHDQNTQCVCLWIDTRSDEKCRFHRWDALTRGGHRRSNPRWTDRWFERDSSPTRRRPPTTLRCLKYILAGNSYILPEVITVYIFVTRRIEPGGFGPVTETTHRSDDDDSEPPQNWRPTTNKPGFRNRRKLRPDRRAQCWPLSTACTHRWSVWHIHDRYRMLWTPRTECLARHRDTRWPKYSPLWCPLLPGGR